jgi:hypothetical protein
VKTNFGVDYGQAAGFAGYLDGMSAEVETSRYIGSVVSYTYKRLAELFGEAADAAARLSPQNFRHVYEWGASYDDDSTVGLKSARLWRLVSTGNGRNRIATFEFLPSVRPVPINPVLLVPNPKTGKTVRQGIHIFTWKARVLEEGTPVTIKTISAKVLAFVGSSGNITFRKGPMTVTPRQYQGNFSRYFLAWWNIEAPQLFDYKIRPEIESDLFPSTKMSQIRTKYRTRAKSFSIGVVSGAENFSSASVWAKRDIRAKETKYTSSTGRFSKYGG